MVFNEELFKSIYFEKKQQQIKIMKNYENFTNMQRG